MFREKGKEREKERERNFDWLSLLCPHLGTWPTTQAGALTGTQTGELSVLRLALNPLSHTSQGMLKEFIITKPLLYENVKGLIKEKKEAMKSKMRTNSQLSTTEPKKQKQK